jgi:hypothetical protein
MSDSRRHGARSIRLIRRPCIVARGPSSSWPSGPWRGGPSSSWPSGPWRGGPSSSWPSGPWRGGPSSSCPPARAPAARRPELQLPAGPGPQFARHDARPTARGPKNGRCACCAGFSPISHGKCCPKQNWVPFSRLLEGAPTPCFIKPPPCSMIAAPHPIIFCSERDSLCQI